MDSSVLLRAGSQQSCQHNPHSSLANLDDDIGSLSAWANSASTPIGRITKELALLEDQRKVLARILFIRGKEHTSVALKQPSLVDDQLQAAQFTTCGPCEPAIGTGAVGKWAYHGTGGCCT